MWVEIDHAGRLAANPPKGNGLPIHMRQKYLVVGIRSDGSRLLLADDLELHTAEKIKAGVAAGIFADVALEIDTGHATGKQSCELFPDTPK